MSGNMTLCESFEVDIVTFLAIWIVEVNFMYFDSKFLPQNKLFKTVCSVSVWQHISAFICVILTLNLWDWRALNYKSYL